MWGVYDLVGGTFVTGLDAEPERTPVQLDAGQIQPALKVTDPAKTLDKIVASFRKVTSDEAKAKYRTQMRDLGVPDLQVPTTGTSSPFLYPVHLAIAWKGSTERVIAIDGFRSRPDADLGHELYQGDRQRPPVTRHPDGLSRLVNCGGPADLAGPALGQTADLTATTRPTAIANRRMCRGLRRPASRPPTVPPTTLDTASTAATFHIT